MKKFSYVFFAIALLSTTIACNNKQKTREEQIEDFRIQLTAEDSTTMLRLADDAMEQLKGKHIDQVIASLYEYTDSTQEVKRLSDQTAKRYARLFKMFPVIEYEREYFSFMLEGVNDVKYKVTFATAEQTGTGEPATTMFMFNPVKVDGEWKLCVKTPEDEIDQEKN